MNYKKQILPNGLTLITVPMKDSVSVTVLVMVKAGSKYESKEINGLSHFLEHMCFKGTEKRPRTMDISIELDRIGSQNNAFTAQEFTGYYAKSHPNHFDTILDVVSDIYLNPVFDPKEIEKEKGVIIEEINMYEDMPHRIVHEVFAEALYGDQPAGWNIAGTKENVSRMTREDLTQYRSQHYVAGATTVIVAGSFDENTIEEKINKSFASIGTTTQGTKVPVVEVQTEPIIKIKQKETDQTHIVLGVRTFDALDERNHALRVLSTILGGGMSSRLFQKLREEMGVGYYVRAGTDEYTDHGYLAVSTGVDVNRVEEVVSAVLSEFRKIITERVSDDELDKAKQYMIGGMYLGLESSDSLAEYYAMQDILGEELLSPDQYAEKIKKVTAEDIENVARDVMTNDRLVMAMVGNIQNEESLKKVFVL